MTLHIRTLARFATAASFLLAPSHVYASVQDTQVWSQLNVIVPLTQRFRITIEQISRFSDLQSGLFQTEYGGLLGYRVAKGVELGFGYRRVGAHNGNKAADEDRLRQQMVVTSGHIVARLRLDERFNPGGHEIGFRLRPLIRYNQPVGTKGLALFVSHESFILPNNTHWGQRSGYDRMRNAIGLAFPIGKALNADIGYLNQYRPAHGSSRGEMDHALNMQLTVNFGAIAPPLLHD
jgi:hypothetical protein